MEVPFFGRIADGLKEQQRNLLGWLRGTPAAKRSLHLGNRSEEEIREHLEILESAIQKAEREELGVCTVCHEYVEPQWLETNYTSCVCLDHLSGEERERLEAELELSQKVQKALLPQSVPHLPGWELAAFSQPASIVGGDYFDFLHFRDGSEALVIADVMGKGMPASMLMASLQASLKIIVPESSSPDQVLVRANQLFCHNIHLSKFVTIVVAQLDTATGNLRYANAGHHPPFHLRRGERGSNSIIPLRPTGAAIGLVEHATFEVRSISLGPGDSLVLYTDGVVEAPNAGREEFGEDRLTRLMAEHVDTPPSELIRDLRKSLQAHVAGYPLQDDMTILVCRRKP